VTPNCGTGCPSRDTLFQGRLSLCPKQGVAYVQRQDVCHFGRQGVVVRLFSKNKTVSDCSYRRLVASNWLPTCLQRDGLGRRAGDGARTRDSLLGRQELYSKKVTSQLLRSCSFLTAIPTKNDASLRTKYHINQAMEGIGEHRQTVYPAS
jgi:hypothetical protein